MPGLGWGLLIGLLVGMMMGGMVVLAVGACLAAEEAGEVDDV